MIIRPPGLPDKHMQQAQALDSAGLAGFSLADVPRVGAGGQLNSWALLQMMKRRGMLKGRKNKRGGEPMNLRQAGVNVDRLRELMAGGPPEHEKKMAPIVGPGHFAGPNALSLDDIRAQYAANAVGASGKHKPMPAGGNPLLAQWAQNFGAGLGANDVDPRANFRNLLMSKIMRKRSLPAPPPPPAGGSSGPMYR